MKGSLGTGILAMPNAFHHSGYVVGSIGTIFIGIVCTYCIHMLLRSAYELCKRKKVILTNQNVHFFSFVDEVFINLFISHTYFLLPYIYIYTYNRPLRTSNNKNTLEVVIAQMSCVGTNSMHAHVHSHLWARVWYGADKIAPTGLIEIMMTWSLELLFFSSSTEKKGSESNVSGHFGGGSGRWTTLVSMDRTVYCVSAVAICVSKILV